MRVDGTKQWVFGWEGLGTREGMERAFDLSAQSGMEIAGIVPLSASIPVTWEDSIRSENGGKVQGVARVTGTCMGAR